MEDYQEIEFVLREQDYQAEIQVRGLKGGSTPLFLVIFLAITITCFFSSHHMFFFCLWKVSRTRIVSIPQFTHKHSVAATRSYVALPRRTPISSGKMSCDFLLKYNILCMHADFDLL